MCIRIGEREIEGFPVLIAPIVVFSRSEMLRSLASATISERRQSFPVVERGGGWSYELHIGRGLEVGHWDGVKKDSKRAVDTSI